MKVRCDDIQVEPGRGYSIDVTLSSPEFDHNEIVEYIDRERILDEADISELLDRIELGDLLSYLVDNFGYDTILDSLDDQGKVTQYFREKRLGEFLGE